MLNLFTGKNSTPEATIRMCKEWFRSVFDWFPENYPRLLLAFISVFLGFLVCLLVREFVRQVFWPIYARKQHLDPKKPDISGTALGCRIWVAFFRLGLYLLNLPPALYGYAEHLVNALQILTWAWFADNMSRGVISVLRFRLHRDSPESYPMNTLLLDLSQSLIKLFIWLYAIFSLMQYVLHIDVSRLLVGAGVVGMGIAFASQNTIANLFGAFAILGSKLFKVGDWIRVNGMEGTVEKIGFRSVSIRAFDGHLFMVPNRIVSDSIVENETTRIFWREHFVYGLVYDTTPEQMRQAMGILYEIGDDLSSLMAPDRKVKFFFLNYNASSLDIEGFVWFNTADGMQRREYRNRFNLEVLKRFNAAGLSFAYPTTTVYLQNPEADNVVNQLEETVQPVENLKLKSEK